MTLLDLSIVSLGAWHVETVDLLGGHGLEKQQEREESGCRENENFLGNLGKTATLFAMKGFLGSGEYESLTKGLMVECTLTLN